jgi:hypothetical protein
VRCHSMQHDIFKCIIGGANPHRPLQEGCLSTR